MKLVLTVALLIHTALFVYAINKPVNLDGDKQDYATLAQNIRDKGHFGYESPSYFRAPGYPFLMFLFGTGKLLFLFQALCSLGTCVLTYLLAKPYGERLAIVCGIAMSLAPMSNFYSTELLTECTYTFLVTLGIYFWDRQVPSGIAFGLSWFIRPVTMPFLLFVLVTGLIRKEWRRPLMVLVACLVVSPWIVRNAIVFHKFVPVASGGGSVNLLAGTMNFSMGTFVWRALENSPEMQTPYSLYDPRTDQLFLDRALQKIRTDPLGWVVTRAKQYPRLFYDSGWYVSSHPAWKGVLIVGNILFLLLSLFGIWLLRFKSLTIFPVFTLLFYLPFWVEARYSVPIVPMMIVLAGIAVKGLANNHPPANRDCSAY